MSEPLPITAVIFDMDGVLTDSEPLINAAAVAMFREKGLQVKPEDFVPFVGAGEDRYLGGVAELYGFSLDLPAAKHRTYELYLEFVPAQLAAFPGAVDLVQECRRAGLKLALASSADRVKIIANLEKIGLPEAHWDAVVSAEDATARKPPPDLFLTAAARLGVAAEQCVVLEDAINGVQAAKAAGMRCVAVCQTFAAAQLESADLIRPALADVSLADLLGLPPGSRSSPAPPVGDLPPLIRKTTPPGRREGWGFWATLGLGLLIACACLLAQALGALLATTLASLTGHRIPSNQVGGNGLVISMATCLAAPVAVGLSLLFARLRSPRPEEYLGFRWPKPRRLLPWGLAMILLMGASDLLTLSLGRPLVPEFMEQVYATAGFQPLLWLALIVAAPISEETLFRGFFFVGLVRSRLGTVGTVIVTALLWAGIHLQYDVYGIANVFVSGLLLGAARVKTGSLYTTILLHGLMNLVATVETAWLFRLSLSGT